MLKDQLHYMSIQEVMEHLDVSRSTIDRWRKHKRLPSIKIGKEIYFDKYEVQRWYREMVRTPRTSEEAASEPVLTIGYTAVSTHMWSPIVMKAFGLLDKELARIRPHDRIDIRWHRAKDGMELVKGLLAGHIHIATFGDYAFSVSQLLGRMMPDFHPVLLAGAGKSPPGSGFAFVVPRGVVLEHPSELATLPLATTTRTNSEYRLRKMLESYQLPELNIVHRTIEDSLESLRQGRLGATVMWEPYLSIARYERIGEPIFERELGSAFFAGVAAEKRWIRDHEDITVAYLKAHLHASRLFREQPQLAAPAVCKETGLPLEAVLRSIANIRWDAALYKKDLKLIEHVDPVFPQSNHLTAAETDIAYSIHYLRIAAQELKLPVPPAAPIEGDWQRHML